jgi:hypothetical protein
MTPPEHEVALWDETAQGRLTGETLPDADLYGLTGLSTSRFGAYRAAALIRGRGKSVVAGGMDVTGHYLEGHGAELLQHYDAIVVGRLTRKLWRQVLDDCARNGMRGVYQADPEDPWEFPIPRHDLVDRKRYFAPATVRTSAGCTEACPFCVVHLVVGGRRVVHCKPARVLEKELEILPKSRFLVDVSDSFGSDYSHTVDVVLPLLRDSRRAWGAEMTVKALLGGDDRRALIQPMARSGCAAVLLGIESIHHPVGAKSLGASVVEEGIKRAHDAGLLVMGAIILDLTGAETRASIEETVDWVNRVELDALQYTLLGLLPGSVTRKVALRKNMLIDNNPEHLDGGWPTIAHPLSPKERIELRQWAFRNSYSYRSLLRKLLRPHVPGRMRIAAIGAFWHAHKCAARFQKLATYEQWLATRILPEHTGAGSSDPQHSSLHLAPTSSSETP